MKLQPLMRGFGGKFRRANASLLLRLSNTVRITVASGYAIIDRPRSSVERSLSGRQAAHLVAIACLQSTRFTEHETGPGPFAGGLSVSSVPPVCRGHLDGAVPQISQKNLELKRQNTPMDASGSWSFVVKVQHVLDHPGHELPEQPVDAPFLRVFHGLSCFFEIWRTVPKEMLPANWIAMTPCPRNGWKRSVYCPSGGLLARRR